MNVDQNRDPSSIESFEWPIFGSMDNENIWGVPNKIFSLVITMSMANFDVSRVLNDEGSYDIIYVKFITM